MRWHLLIGRGFGGKPLEWLRLLLEIGGLHRTSGVLGLCESAHARLREGPVAVHPSGPAGLAMPHLALSRLVPKRYLATPGRPADGDSSGDVSVWAPVGRCHGTQRRFGSLGTVARSYLISVRDGVGRVCSSG